MGEGIKRGADMGMEDMEEEDIWIESDRRVDRGK